jgi:hypothetical protein
MFLKTLSNYHLLNVFSFISVKSHLMIYVYSRYNSSILTRSVLQLFYNKGDQKPITCSVPPIPKNENIRDNFFIILDYIYID